jgi:hypothetical protein
MPAQTPLVAMEGYARSKRPVPAWLLLYTMMRGSLLEGAIKAACGDE